MYYTNWFSSFTPILLNPNSFTPILLNPKYPSQLGTPIVSNQTHYSNAPFKTTYICISPLKRLLTSHLIKWWQHLHYHPLSLPVVLAILSASKFFFLVLLHSLPWSPLSLKLKQVFRLKKNPKNYIILRKILLSKIFNLK